MDKLSQFITQKVIPNLSIIAIMTFTGLTSSIATYKISQELPAPAMIQSKIEEVISGQGNDITNAPKADESTNSSVNGGTDEVIASTGFLPADTSLLPQTGASQAAGTGSASSLTTCIVKIAGNTYNFQSLITTHTGGNVFKCNTDQTSLFKNQHGTNYAKIAKYLISSGSTASSSSSTGTNTGTNTGGNSGTGGTGATGGTTPTQAPGSGSNPSLCLVVINGSTYNLYPLKTTHSGGDLFNCNTDQTALYKSKHGTNYSRIQMYFYASGTTAALGGGGNTGGTNPTGTPIPTFTPIPLPTPKVGACNVIINGNIYNMNRENFARKHAGGDVFICGADQTALFNSKHGTKYNMLSDYYIGKAP